MGIDSFSVVKALRKAVIAATVVAGAMGAGLAVFPVTSIEGKITWVTIISGVVAAGRFLANWWKVSGYGETEEK